MKLPRTLHLEGSRLPLGGTDPDAIKFNKLSGRTLIIEEKMDGTGVSLSLDSHLNLQVMHRGSPAVGTQYRDLFQWANNYWEELFDLLGERYTLFGEWNYYKHTIFYDNLPHHFLESDIFDQQENCWLDTASRDKLLKNHTYIQRVPVLEEMVSQHPEDLIHLIKKPTHQSKNWKEKLKTSCLYRNVDYQLALDETDSSELMEGLYVKEEANGKVVGRYKYVRYQFLKNILDSKTHFKDRPPIPNGLSGAHYNEIIE